MFHSTHVTAQTGTGLVHSAPGHGHEDYDAFQTAGLSTQHLRCPVDDQGQFMPEVDQWSDGQSTGLVGLSVLGEGSAKVIELLKEDGILLAEMELRHRYPYDWKTKQPVIIRATPQWFADLSEIKPMALSSLQEVDFVPPQCT